MNFLSYLAAFALLIGLLIVVHELGHYAVARCVGVKVLRFSVGFGRTLLLKRIGRDGTEWALCAFPIGGYVKMLDESEGEVAPHELHRSFNRQSVWKRMGIVAAGPLANLLLAVLVYWGLFVHGAEELRPVLAAPVAASAAAEAGIEDGERVLKVAGESVQTWQEFRWHLLRRMVGQEAVDLEVINLRHEVAIRRLHLSQARNDGWEGDALEKLGINLFHPAVPPIIGKISPGSVAESAGLNPGDEILSIDHRPVTEWSEVVHTVRASPRVPLLFEIKRNEERFRIEITPSVVQDNGREIGRIGAAVGGMDAYRKELMVTVRYGLVPALGKAVTETWDKSVFSLQMIGKMITGVVSWRNISGPVTIADYAGQSAKLGAVSYLKFLALVSISLAVLNLLPVPILDGGHLLYYFAEVVRRKPLSEQSMEIGQRIGLALILMLLAFAFYNDINRLVSG